jgi:dipeptidyl aminopeptidase/acylaminoacyl peptidase
MEAVRETTVWTGVEYQQPNHDYLLDGDRVVAYRPWGTAEIRVLSGKIKIDRRGRKFEKLEPNPFKGIGEKKEPVVLEVKGSKGNVYYVNPEEKTCSCPGFTFRGSCKHLGEHG